jgi:hypothetical protein
VELQQQQVEAVAEILQQSQHQVAVLAEVEMMVIAQEVDLELQDKEIMAEVEDKAVQAAAEVKVELDQTHLLHLAHKVVQDLDGMLGQ